VSKSGRDKHSFIQFYFDDWKSGTAHMSRLVRSVYFDVCLFNWDKRRPVPPSTLVMMLADVEEAGRIIDALVDEGVLVADSNGSIHSPRAMREADRAYAAWEKKSRGGKISRGSLDSDAEPALLEDSSQDSSDTPAETAPQNQTQNQNHIEEEDRRDSDSLDCQSVVVAWNDMARSNGLKQVVKMSAARIGRLAALVEEHGGFAPLIAGINLIPRSPFLLGKAGERGFEASFDWFLKEDSLIKIAEGLYEPRNANLGGHYKRAGVTAQTAEGAAQANDRLAAMGSILRWQLDGQEWVLKPGSPK
jgi:uncharacterized protein YdaU (DUF1376 family)